MRMLDAGAYGVICPMINKASDAEHFAQLVITRPLVKEASVQSERFSV